MALIIIMPCVALIMITSKTNIFLGVRSYVVESGSMTPTLPVGSVIFSQKQTHYKVGDIITFVRSGVEVTHRIKSAAQGGSFLVQGDANKVVDADPVKISDIKGKEFFMIPYVGRVIFFVKSLPGLILLIILPCSLLILFELWNLKRHIEVATEEKVRKKLTEELRSAK